MAHSGDALSWLQSGEDWVVKAVRSLSEGTDEGEFIQCFGKSLAIGSRKSTSVVGNIGEDYAIRPTAGTPFSFVMAMNRLARAAKAPAGSLSPRSHLANVPGSTPISSAAPSRDSPRVVRCRTNCSARLLASGKGL